MILVLGKTRWLLGMHWNAFEAAPSYADIRSEAGHLGANRYALRISDLAVQAGFANLDHANPTKGGKLYSLAARLASAVAEPWFGIFDLGGGLYWYIAVRDGYSILPEGDVVGTREEVERIRDFHSGHKDWKTVYDDVQYLESLLADIATKENSGIIPKSKLVSVESFGANQVIVWRWIAMILGAAVLLGVIWYCQAYLSEQKARQAAQQAKIEQEQLQLSQALAPLAAPAPGIWLNACKEALFALPLSQFAWQLVQVECSNAEVQTQWKLAPGATIKNRPQGVLSADATQVSQSNTLQFPPGSNSFFPPGTMQENLTALRVISQSAGIELSVVSNDAQNQSVLPGQVTQVVNKVTASSQSPIQKQAFSISSKAAPFAIDFSTVPGMRIQKITNNLVDNQGWKLEGMVYGY